MGDGRPAVSLSNGGEGAYGERETMNPQKREALEAAGRRFGDAAGLLGTTQSDGNYVPLIVAEADPSLTLEQVQKALAKIPGSLVEDFASERDERF